MESLSCWGQHSTGTCGLLGGDHCREQIRAGCFQVIKVAPPPGVLLQTQGNQSMPSPPRRLKQTRAASHLVEGRHVILLGHSWEGEGVSSQKPLESGWEGDASESPESMTSWGMGWPH